MIVSTIHLNLTYVAIFSDTVTGVLISNSNFVDSLTIKGKEYGFAVNQCIPNMVNFATNLSIMALTKGNIIEKTKVNRIAAIYSNYFEKRTRF